MPSSCPRFLPGDWPGVRRPGKLSAKRLPVSTGLSVLPPIRPLRRASFSWLSRQRPKTSISDWRKTPLYVASDLTAWSRRPTATAHGRREGGQLVTCSLTGAGTLDGISRCRYDGTPLPVDPAEVMRGGNNDEMWTARLQAFPAEGDFRIARSRCARPCAGRIATGENGLLFVRLGEDVDTRRRPPGPLGRPCPQHRGHRARHGGGSRAGRRLSYYEVPPR